MTPPTTPARSSPAPSPAPRIASRPPGNDLNARDAVWRRLRGNDWDAFDALPPPVRQRLCEHAYEPWAVNALALWKSFRRRHASSPRALNTLLRHLDRCEAMERALFDAAYRDAHGGPLPHVGAGASVMRYAASCGT